MKTILEIAISHQRQMSSVHPHAVIGTIEDAINEALNTPSLKQNKEPEELISEFEDYMDRKLGLSNKTLIHSFIEFQTKQ